MTGGMSGAMTGAVSGATNDQPSSPTLLEDLRAGAIAATAMLLVGAPAGLLWAWLTPDISTVFDDAGRPGLREYESGQFFTVEVTYLLVTAAVGIACGVLATRLLRRHGPTVAAGLALGGAVAGLVAREVGERVVVNSRVVTFCAANPKDGFCTIFDGRIDSRSPQLWLGLAFAALVTQFALTYFRDHRQPELVDAPGAGAFRQVGQL